MFDYSSPVIANIHYALNYFSMLHIKCFTYKCVTMISINSNNSNPILYQRLKVLIHEKDIKIRFC